MGFLSSLSLRTILVHDLRLGPVHFPGTTPPHYSALVLCAVLVRVSGVEVLTGIQRALPLLLRQGLGRAPAGRKRCFLRLLRPGPPCFHAGLEPRLPGASRAQCWPCMVRMPARRLPWLFGLARGTHLPSPLPAASPICRLHGAQLNFRQALCHSLMVLQDGRGIAHPGRDPPSGRISGTGRSSLSRQQRDSGRCPEPQGTGIGF